VESGQEAETEKCVFYYPWLFNSPILTEVGSAGPVEDSSQLDWNERYDLLTVETEAETNKLLAQLAEKDQLMAEKDQLMAEKDAEKDQLLAQLAEKDQLAAEKDAEKDRLLAEQAATMKVMLAERKAMLVERN
jgi:hypothetical protein